MSNDFFYFALEKYNLLIEKYIYPNSYNVAI